MSKQRHPRELLYSILNWCFVEHCQVGAYGPGSDAWTEAASDVRIELLPVAIQMPPDPVKRAYYGSTGSLRNPGPKW